MENCLGILVNKNDDVEKTLQSFNYEIRSGSGGYNRDKIMIVPKKKWYWFCNGNTGTKNLYL